MNRLKHYTFIACFLQAFFVSINIYAQEELRYFNITADQGLSQSVVNCIYQDKRGFMWFGTQDGLNRYDGVTITVYKNNPVDSASLAANNINCIYEDNKGILWIGTEGGLSAFNTYTGKFTNYYHSKEKNSLTSSYISSVFCDKSGNLWIGTMSNGLNLFHPGTNSFTRYWLPSSDTGSANLSYTSSISEDSSGSLWLGTFGKGIYSFNVKTGSIKNYLQYTSDGKLQYLLEDKVTALYYEQKSGNLYVGTFGNSLEVFNISERRFTHYYFNADTTLASSPGLIKAMSADSYGNLWIAAANGEGVFKFRRPEETFVSYKGTQGSSLSFNDNVCNSLYIGNDGIIWVGTNNGIAYYVPEKRNFVNYKDTSNHSANVVMSLAREGSGRLWIGTDGAGLYSYDENTKTYNFDKSLNESINNKSILSLYIDKRDILWIGSWGAGASGYNLISGRIINIDSINPDLGQATVTEIIQDNYGKVWIGTYGKGIYIYDEKTKGFTTLNTSNGLSDNRIYSLYEDKQHNMWIGTDGGGLNCYNLSNGKNIVFKKTSGKNTISFNSVDCVYEDDAGNIWIGTGAGLNKYSPTTHKFVNYFEKDGLPNDYIYSILPDKEGNLWISTNKGLSKFNPKAAGEEANAFKNYDESDGLGENEFNQGACLRSPEGKMFFGGMNGIVCFYPEKVIGNTHIPPIYVTSCELFGKEYAMDTAPEQKKYLNLSWKDNTLSFSFVALDYQIPSKNRYSYMMEGVDKEWSPASNRHFASYAQLPPGNYVFRVKGCNNDGAWNDAGTALYITIVPPFWKTNWFYATCIILTIISIFSFIRYRTNRIEKEKKILETKVEERTHELAQRTHELAQKNRDITSSIEYARRIQQAILPPQEEIKRELPESFILYLPKDIVSGDFYWFGKKDDKLILAAADCTGHGVPGALMSMIGHNLLNQIVMEQGHTQPATILNHLNSMVQSALKQGISNIDTSDGMDMALCCIDKSTGELNFAGAYRPLVIINGSDMVKIDPDKMPIGGSQISLSRNYKNHTHKLKPGDTIYMFSDGYADQFGGENGKKFMLRRFIDTLQSFNNLSMDKQEALLSEGLINWRGNNEQVDDILVIGMHF